MNRFARVAAAWGLIVTVVAAASMAAEPSAHVAPFHGYDKAIELTRGGAKAVLCPQVGGRVLEFTVDGRSALQLDEEEKSWKPGDRPVSAGRFDYGPELVTIPHPSIWSGEWSGEITGQSSARLTSPRDEKAGIQLVRDFELTSGGNGGTSLHLICRQTIRNVCDELREVCHWGRSFSPGGGVCLIPLGDSPSRFPSHYAMYEDSAIINVRNTDDQIRVRDGFLEILAPPRKPKLGFDTMAGWFGYLMPNNTLFVKRFPTYPDRVYNEAAGLTMSVWYPPATRIELEPIGPRERLKPGESASFVEDWWLLSFPYPAQGEQVDLAALQSLVSSQTSPP